jgi:hypothetical protein
VTTIPYPNIIRLTLANNGKPVFVNANLIEHYFVKNDLTVISFASTHLSAPSSTVGMLTVSETPEQITDEIYKVV